MLTISPEVSKSLREENSLNNLLRLINDKLARVANGAWVEQAFSTGCTSSYEHYRDLITYREIVLQKVNGCGNCYSDYSLKQIISKIKTLTA